MKTTGIKNLAIGALCAGLMAIGGVASAASWGHHGFRGGYVHHLSGGIGLDLGIGIGAPVYSAPAYVDPYYYPPYYGPTVGADFVIGGGWGGGWVGGGHYYHGGGGFSHGGGGYSHGGGGRHR